VCVLYILSTHSITRVHTPLFSHRFVHDTICITQALKIFGFYVVCFDSARYNRHYMRERSAQLGEVLRYMPKGAGSIPEEATEIFH
jgi:hypothetical protein